MTLVGGWGIKNKISVLPIFADYFDTTTWKQRLRKKRMVHLLNSQSIPVVCNHNLPACQSMRTAGVDQNKILTYDWPAIRYPENHPVKSLPDKNENATIVYAGSVSESKGVGDLLEAIRLLKDDNCKCQLFICGKGADYDTYRHHVQQSSIRDSVTFEGLLSNTDVLKKMEEATLVVVPSHSEFPEGLPNVIYESFETRTPLVCSDHPSFKQLLTPEEGCLFFPQKSPKTLADRIRRALTSESDYTALSRTTSQAWQRVQCPLTFGQVLTAWKQSTDDALTKLLKKGGLKSVEHATKTASNN